MDWKVTVITVLAATVAGVHGDCSAQPKDSLDHSSIDVIEAQVGAYEGLYTLTCVNELNVFTHDNALELADCINGEWNFNKGVKCDGVFEPVALFQCETHEAPDGAMLVDTISKASTTETMEIGKLYECEPGKAWLSGSRVKMSKCQKDGQWSDIFDMCDDDCAVPRDCVDVASLGFNESSVYYVIPSGNPLAEAAKVFCKLDEDLGNSGWTKILETKSEWDLNSDAGMEHEDEEGENYWIGKESLFELMENECGEERPLTLAIEIERPNGKISHATYGSFRFNTTGLDDDPNTETPPEEYELILERPYHGNAGDNFAEPEDEVPIKNWAYFGDKIRKLEWAPLITHTTVARIKAWIRPQDFDMAYSCPPMVGYEPAWWREKKTTWVDMPMNRTAGTIIYYNCKGELIEEGNDTNTDEEIRTTEGWVSCDLNAAEDAYEWNTTVVLPCTLNCPDEFFKTEVQIKIDAEDIMVEKCIHFSEDEKGLTGAALSCGEKEASLAFVNKLNYNHTEALTGPFLTSHVKKEWLTDGSEELTQPLKCTGRLEDCKPTEDDGYCMTVEFDDINLLTDSSAKHAPCNVPESKYMCMRPAECREDYTHVKGFCYRFIDETAEISIIEILKKCEVEGAALAWPQTLEQLEDILAFINRTDAGDEVLVGINNARGDWKGLDETYAKTKDAMADLDTMKIKETDGNPDNKWRYLADFDSDVTFKPTDLEKMFKLAVCQHQGPIGCPIPGPSKENMVDDRDEAKQSFKSEEKIIYTCNKGFFMNYNKNQTNETSHTETCIGQLGNWWPIGALTCLAKEVCFEEPVTEPLMVNETSAEHRFLNGSITYRCPDGMGYTAGNKDEAEPQLSTCSFNEGTSEYAFEPATIESCTYCILEPNVTGLNIDTTDLWVDATDYEAGEANGIITATCLTGYFVNGIKDETEQELICNSTGWLPVEPCVRACLEDPPIGSGGMNMTGDETGIIVGSTRHYRCPEDLYIPTVEECDEVVSETNMTCMENGTWEGEERPLTCETLCIKDPADEPENGTAMWSSFNRTVGTEVMYECDEGMVFADGSSSINVTCEDTGEWTDIQQGMFLCRELCPVQTPPAAPENMTLVDGNGTMFMSDEVEYHCNGNNSAGPNGKTFTTSSCAPSNWTEIDPTFICMEACHEDPPLAEAPVTSNFDSEAIAKEGTVVEYKCTGGVFFKGSAKESATLNVTCTQSTWSLEELPYCDVSIDGAPTTPPPIVLPTQPPGDPSYPETTDLYWGTIHNNMTNVGDGTTEKTDGPFGFGYAVSVDSKQKQCLTHDNFGDSLTDSDAKDCTSDPNNCDKNGLSISVWEKAVFDHSIFDENLYKDGSTENPKYVLSTGGDTLGHPGVAIYHHGLQLVAVVSTGDQYWELKVMGPMRNDTWNNIALRWESTSEGEGLELYVNLEMVGQQKHAKTQTPKLDKKPLKPQEMMLGCHKTSTNSTYYGYNDAAYDELALWTRRLNDTDRWFFLGGYEESFADITTDEFQSMLDRVDLEDPAQQAAAVNILSAMTNTESEPEPSPPTSATVNEPSVSSESNPTKETPETKPTAKPTEKAVEKSPAVDKAKLDNLAKMSNIMEKMTDVKKVKDDITEDELKTYMKLVDVASNILSSSSASEWVGLLNEEDNPGASKTTTRLEDWAMQLISNSHFDNESEPIDYVKNTDNMIIRVNKMEVQNLTKMGFYETPVYSKEMKNKWNVPFDRIAVPAGLFTNTTCKNRPVSIMSSIYDSYDEYAPTVVSPATLNPSSINALDSRVLSIQIRADPDYIYQLSQEKDPCYPDPDYLRDNPTRIKLEHNLKMTTLRRLQFHENEIVTEIKQRYCVWWNPALSDFGAWDAKGCRILKTTEEYTKCACDHIGTFAVMAEKIDPIVVPEEATWLSITKYIGYGISFLFLVLYILVIAFSGDLKEQFHLMGLNLAVAILFGSIFMIISDFTHDDRHTCTAIGSLIHFFYLAAGAWMALLGHASFKAITSGVIGGRLKAYCFIAWGIPLISLGVSYIFFLHDLGTDPRCFISWNNNAKYVFFAPQILFMFISFFFGMIVLCNMSTPALRKDNLVADYGTFCRGASFLMIFFDITWTFGLFAYVRFGFTEPDFFPIFQVLNSWMGVLVFLFIGICSNRFRMILAGQSKLRKEMLLGAALGRNHNYSDKDKLNTPEDENSRASSAFSSPAISRSSSTRSRPSTAASIVSSRPTSTSSKVAGRPGSRTLQ